MSKYSEIFRKFELKKNNNTHRKILDLVGKKKKVIDFGCAAGYLDEILVKKHHCKVWGVELNERDASKAAKICEKVIVADIEQTEKWAEKLGGEKFDVAIFADVLEHLKNPLEVLKAARKVIKRNGYLVTSIPNVAHFSQRIELLLGQWRYEPLGLMDDTHIRFFTHAEIVSMLHSAKYYVRKVEFKTENIPRKVIENYMKRYGYRLTPELEKMIFAPDALVYQYIVKASVKKPKNYRKPGVKIYPKIVMEEWGGIKFETQSYKDKIKLLEEDLRRIKNSRAYKLWQYYSTTKRKIINVFK